jgi:hypothetical protein
MVLALAWIKPNSPHFGNSARSFQDRVFLYRDVIVNKFALPGCKAFGCNSDILFSSPSEYGAQIQTRRTKSSNPFNPSPFVSLLREARPKTQRRKDAGKNNMAISEIGISSEQPPVSNIDSLDKWIRNPGAAWAATLVNNKESSNPSDPCLSTSCTRTARVQFFSSSRSSI